MIEKEIFPHKRERQLCEEWKKEKDREKRRKIEEQLVSLYVYVGEYFKMSRPDPKQAKVYLQKALRYRPDHAIANYRLAHVYYAEAEYGKAAFHFERALSDERGGKLTDTQQLISCMLLANCGILLASKALKKIEEMEDSSYDEELVERYRGEILLQRAEDFARALYCIVTPDGRDIVAEERYFAEQEKCLPREVQLLISDGDGLLVRYEGGKWMTLDYASFYLLALLLHSERPLTGEEIRETLFFSFLERGVTEAAIRKMIERLRTRLSFWEEMIETTRIGSKAARRRQPSVSYRIFCRASDVFPWET
ncbi:hypothetical protein M493_10670 [Geobacillus genomosp. 3]|uniref:Uncharacterized protein n=1 Tax=Geobacillus genomosp. 3 TaxID=1921421 RepID=S5ZDU2_GEOG3|nr:tetratricopeptide repeat protein [Geobacillus genomosp. 3]AGT32395.1 hypothetical protein M493_10670 [Geobacillus genomosp. 3]